MEALGRLEVAGVESGRRIRGQCREVGKQRDVGLSGWIEELDIQDRPGNHGDTEDPRSIAQYV